MRAFGWAVLALLFFDEMLCVVAAGVAGYAWLGIPGAILGCAIVITVWALFASPKARFGGPIVRPVVKVLVFGGCSLALVLTGHLWWGIALAAFSIVVNALAQIPAIRDLAAAQTHRDAAAAEQRPVNPSSGAEPDDRRSASA